MINTLEKRTVPTITYNQHLSKRKQLMGFLLIFFGIIIGFLLIATIVLAVLYGIERSNIKIYQKIPDNNVNDVCLSSYCINAANYLLESIDETIDPCENFYKFTCNTWIKKARIPEDVNTQSIFGKMQNRINNEIIDLLSSPLSNETSSEPNSIINTRRLYNSCIDEETIETDDINVILSIINTELGGWPILQGLTWNQLTFDFSRILLKLNEYNKFILFYALTYIDEKNSSTYSIYIGQSTLGLIDRSYYVNESKITRAYQEYIKNIALLLTNDTSMIDTDVNDIFQFEKTIAQYFMTKAEQYVEQHNRTTFGNISSTMNTTFNFSDYLQRLYLLGNVTLIDEDIIIIRELEVLRNISIIINQQSPRTLQNYLIWRFIMSSIEYMPTRFRMIKQQFNKIFQGTMAEKSRIITCTNYVTRTMGLAVSKLYINKYFDENSRNEAIEMINNIRDVFINMINQSIWMDSLSKYLAIEKIQAINRRIGYPDGLNNDNITEFENIYVEFNFNSSFIQNILIISRLNVKKNFEKLREPIDRKAWTSIIPVDVNAYYRPSFNDITFTAAILQTPFFNRDAPKYLNYGGIGMVIAHEITHGFDSMGRQYDKNGNRIPWWTNETINAFDKQKQCIIEQYNNYTVTQINMKINGEQTQGENIADNSGLKEAFLAYQKWTENNQNIDKKLPGLAKYSAEQMFFINFGHLWCSKMRDQYAKNQILTNVHSPAEFRVIGPTSNFGEFDRVFGCKPGQGNSRVNKCTVW